MLLTQRSDSALEVLVAVFQLGLEGLDAILELLLAAIVFLSLLCLLSSLNQHWNAVGVARLDRLLQQLALLLQLARPGPILLGLLLEAFQISELAVLPSDLLLLLAQDLLVFAEPGDFLFKIFDLLFGKSAFRQVLLTHPLHFLVALAHKELSLVESLL